MKINSKTHTLSKATKVLRTTYTNSRKSQLWLTLGSANYLLIIYLLYLIICFLYPYNYITEKKNNRNSSYQSGI